MWEMWDVCVLVSWRAWKLVNIRYYWCWDVWLSCLIRQGTSVWSSASRCAPPGCWWRSSAPAPSGFSKRCRAQQIRNRALHWRWECKEGDIMMDNDLLVEQTVTHFIPAFDGQGVFLLLGGPSYQEGPVISRDEHLLGLDPVHLWHEPRLRVHK